MIIKDWTVGELVAYLSGNRVFGEVDFFLDRSLRGDKGLISGEFHIRATPQKRKNDRKRVREDEV